MDQPSGVPPRHIPCVHCHSLIPLGAAPAEELVCPECAGVIRLRVETGLSTAPEVRRLGRFELLDRLGAGSFGTVWKARDSELGRFVALKLMHAGALGSPADRERFLREARAAAQLRHPGILPVHEVTDIDGQPVIVADFIQGITLRDLLQNRRLTFRAAAVLTAEIALALEHAHAQGIVHRDVKPANIMLEAPAGVDVAALAGLTDNPTLTAGESLASSQSGTATGQARPRAMLLDFGLALRADAEVTMTAEGQIVGTPAYMSPEQAAGHGHRVDRRSDVYSLGVVLYELLTGERPFRGSRVMLIHQVLHEEPRPPRRCNDRIPRDLETICLKAMAKEPGRRYATAAALADDLRRYLAGEPIRAKAVGPVERAWKWARRQPAVAALLVVTPVALLALVGLTVGFLYNRQLVAARQAEEAQRRRAESALEESLSNLYFHRVGAAEREWTDGNPARALELLAECPPERRQWEWHYLDRVCHPELPVLTGHTDRVFSTAFSPDGSLVASSGCDGTVRLWDARSGRELLVLQGDARYVWGVAFSPDGTLLAGGGGSPVAHQGPLKLWAIDRSGAVVRAREVARVPGLLGGLTRLAFSPDGRSLAVGCGHVVGQPGAAKIYAVDGLKELRTLSTPMKGVFNVAYSPDGRLLATGGGHDTESSDTTPGLLQVWEVATGKEVRRLPVDPTWVTAVAFTSDGSGLACAGERGSVVLLDTAGYQEVRHFRGHRTYVWQLAFRPDGKELATAGEDGTVKIWDVATGDELNTLHGHAADVHGVAYSRKGDRLASCGADRTIRLWDPAASQDCRTFRHHAGTVSSVAFVGDRWLVSAGHDRTVQLWEPYTSAPPRLLGKHADLVWCLAVSPDGTRIAAGGGDWQKRDQLGEVKVYSRTGVEEPLRLRAHAGLVWSVAFAPDGRRLATAGGESYLPGEIKVWDGRTGENLLTIPQPQGVHCVAFSPDGRRLAGVVFAANVVRVWDAATGQEQFSQAVSSPLCVAFSPDGRQLAVGTNDLRVIVWDLTSGQERTIRGHRGPVLGLAFSPDGRRLATATENEVVKLWDVASGQEVLSLRGHRGLLSAVAFSADGRRLASASTDGTVKLWDARPREE